MQSIYMPQASNVRAVRGTSPDPDVPLAAEEPPKSCLEAKKVAGTVERAVERTQTNIWHIF